MTLDKWQAEGRKRFGGDIMQWRFVCPSCGHVARVQDWKDAGAPERQIAFSCVGRALGATRAICKPPGPCNYAGGGLFRLNPTEIEGRENVFAFAEQEPRPQSQGGGGT